MATRTFLTAEELLQAESILQGEGALAVSKFIGEKLEARLSAHPHWRDSRPVKLGSWARNELCIKSDIDLLFFGDEEKVGQMVQDFQRDGIKIRYRMPADLNDWTKQVEAFDIIALLAAKTFFKADEAPLAEQCALIQSRGLKYKKQLFKVMVKERHDRAKRYDSITNYLEPNLKYGPGGLRDLEQGLTILTLFSDIDESQTVIHATLNKCKIELLAYRHFIHLRGASDVFVSQLQHEAATFFAYPSSQNYMSHLEKMLSEVSFYSDWITASAQASKKEREKINKLKVDTLQGALTALKSDSSILVQYKLRNSNIKIQNRKALGRDLEKYINSQMTEDFLIALFGSKIISIIVPDVLRLTGHVQHDQYHRYSVDAHTLQAMREVLRIKKSPAKLGGLSKYIKELTSTEWTTLIWTALYHDLGKGLKGDHSNEGAAIVKRDFTSLGLSLKMTTQVAWLVQNHLIVSTAAFRHNPQSSATWADLFSRGVRDRRILTLTIFTAIDIRATNPEAWNDWKSRLLHDLVKALQSHHAKSLGKFIEEADKKKIKIDRSFIENLDAQVVASLPQQILLKDYSQLKKTKSDLPSLVLRNRKGETWIRLHRLIDKPGLFLNFTRELFLLGLSVQEAYVQTYEGLGVYDWFKIKSSKSVAAIRTGLLQASAAPVLAAQSSVAPVVHFAVIEVVSSDDKNAIISFRGKDQRGALLAAAQALFDCGLEIRAAKVHTWGHQIDDVFTVKKAADFESRIAKLQTV